MKIPKIFKDIMSWGEKNELALNTGLSIAGTILTAITVAQGAIKVYKAYKAYKDDVDSLDNKDYEVVRARKMSFVKEAVVDILPAAATLTVTICSEWRRNKASSAQIKVLSTALMASQKSLSISNDKLNSLKKVTRDIVGEDTANKIFKEGMSECVGKNADSIQRRINPDYLMQGAYPVVDTYMNPEFVIGYSNVAIIEKSITTLTQQCMDETTVSINDLYDALGCKDVPTPLHANLVGWSADSIRNGKLPIDVTTTMLPNGTPCIAIDYEVESFFRRGGAIPI